MCVQTTHAHLTPGLKSHLVDVPLRTSHMSHLKASGVFLYVHTEQSQKPSDSFDTRARFDLELNTHVVNFGTFWTHKGKALEVKRYSTSA